jgi:hypothetical protein
MEGLSRGRGAAEAAETDGVVLVCAAHSRPGHTGLDRPEKDEVDVSWGVEERALLEAKGVGLYTELR